METSVSRGCLQRRTAQMFERCQSLLQDYNNTASLHGWCSVVRGSHTPLQDEGWRAYDGSGEGLQLRKRPTPDVNTEPVHTERIDVITENKRTETDSCQR